MKSISTAGVIPSFSRISCGIVICPFVVTLMAAPPVIVILVLVILKSLFVKHDGRRKKLVCAHPEIPDGHELTWSEGAIYNIGFERGLNVA